MSDLLFRCGEPEDFHWPEPRTLFHEPRHLRLQAAEGWLAFAAIRPNNQTASLIQVHLNEGQAVSPRRAPFGSFLLLNDVSRAELSAFVHYLESALTQRGVHHLEIKCAPEPYFPEVAALIEETLREAGYTGHQDVIACIPVSANAFFDLLHRAERKKLRKCDSAEAVFNPLPLSELDRVHEYLTQWRLRKNLSLSLPLAELHRLAQAFPDRMVLTSVLLHDQWIAANISLRVNRHVMYNFYHDHDPEWDSLSPVVKLNEGLFNICRQEGVHWLDLGTSLDNGRLRQSLLDFKLRLGARPFPKLTFRKSWNA
ncbi:MAG: GNAT family N-acetyltransferase [Cyclobacteriaceae bacterium]